MSASHPIFATGAVVEFRARAAKLPKYPPTAYKVEAKAGDAAEIVIYGVVGDIFDGITASKFADDLKRIQTAKTLEIRINSPGGAVNEGRTIYNRLREHRARKVVHVDGEASSIAALIAMSGDEVRMGEGSLMLVHRAWGITIGNANDHRAMIRDLETVDAAQIDTFSRRTGMDKTKLLALMDEDRYMDAREAVALGFADVAEGAAKMAALVVDRAALHLPQLPADARPNRAAALAKIAAMRG